MGLTLEQANLDFTLLYRDGFREAGDEAEEKREALRNLIGGEDVRGALIFCNRKRDIAVLHKSMRRHGFDDAAIHDATQVVSYFNYINRVADALGVEPEAFTRAWETDRPSGA